MFLINFYVSVLFLCYASASISFHRTGWLDRVVQHRKNLFIKDVLKLPPVQIKATITSAPPPGYEDSPAWDYDSVTRLLTLIRASEVSRDVHRILERELKPTRRFMSRQKSFRYFPRLKQNQDIYYDGLSSDENATESWENEGPGPITNDSIVFVSNPVEARLPSAQISVGLLKQIMWERALAAREMPTTEKTSIPWKPMNKTTTATTKGGDDTNSTAITSAGGDVANSTDSTNTASDGATGGASNGGTGTTIVSGDATTLAP